MVKPNRPVAKRCDGAKGMRDTDQRPSGAAEFFDAADAFVKKILISDSQDFINHQNIGINMYSDGECQPHDHARGVRPEGFLNKIADASEFNDGVYAFRELLSGQAQ